MTNAPVLFLHGLEGSTNGTKASWLRDHYGAYAVDLDTTAARASSKAAQERGERWNHLAPDIKAAFATPLERARAAIGPDTRLIAGSSFGGAVLMQLIEEGTWRGPSLFIASAGTKLTGLVALPSEVRAILLHGRDDTIVPIEDSRCVAANCGPNVQLWEIGDGHRMGTIVQTGILRTAMEALLNG